MGPHHVPKPSPPLENPTADELDFDDQEATRVLSTDQIARLGARFRDHLVRAAQDEEDQETQVFTKDHIERLKARLRTQGKKDK